MAREVNCIKLGCMAEGLDSPPYPGELGQRIYEHISQQAWEAWINHQTMLINEYRLNPTEAEAQKILRQQMEEFLFGGGTAPPPDFVPQQMK